MRGKHYGFTLIELLITLSIVAILVTVAAPNFSSMLQNNRLATQTNLLIADLNFARSESIKRNTTIHLSPSEDGWDSGWNISIAGSDELLRSTEISQQNIGVAPNNGDALTFTSGGNLDSQTSCFAITDAHDDNHSRTVKIETTGRVAITSEECV
ncbi:MAG: GspH/FimT family pseudopilin [Thiotrichales bacterium]|nr:GspH/FimT family pseudopilin [Thiotrichales bacterium]